MEDIITIIMVFSIPIIAIVTSHSENSLQLNKN